MAKARRAIAATVLGSLILLGLPTPPGKADRARCFGRVATHIGNKRGDVIYGTRGNDVIAANGGDDVVWSFGGTDFICGGGGSDFIDGSRGRDHIDGGPGRNDAIGYRYAADGVTVRMSAGRVSGRERDKFSKIEIVFGSQHNDRLYGSARGDLIMGNKGADVVSGLGGNDLLLGLEGNDRIDGGSGNEDTASYYTSETSVEASLMTNTAKSSHHGFDRLSAVEGLEASQYYGGTLQGDDRANGLFTSTFGSSLYGHGGNDFLLGGLGDDWLAGGEGNDVVSGREGFDTLDNDEQPLPPDSIPSAGNDRLIGGDHSDQINGGDGDDRIEPQQGSDTVSGGVGNDLLIDGGGSDGASLGEGDDEARAAPGNDSTFDGETGRDTISFVNLDSPVVVDLGNGFADASGRDALSGFEIVLGGPLGDTLTGDGADNEIYGLDGDDTLAGAEGNDSLDGGNGSDGADGGLGLDTCSNAEDMVGCENLPPILPSPSPTVSRPEVEAISWPVIGWIGGSSGISVSPFRGVHLRAIVTRILHLEMRAPGG